MKYTRIGMHLLFVGKLQDEGIPLEIQRLTSKQPSKTATSKRSSSKNPSNKENTSTPPPPSPKSYPPPSLPPNSGSLFPNSPSQFLGWEPTLEYPNSSPASSKNTTSPRINYSSPTCPAMEHSMNSFIGSYVLMLDRWINRGMRTGLFRRRIRALYSFLRMKLQSTGSRYVP